MSKKWCGHYLSFCAFWALFLVIIDPIISVATNIYSHLMHTFPIWHMTTHPLLIWTESYTNSHFWKGPPYFASAIVEMNALSNSICSRNAYMVWWSHFTATLASILPNTGTNFCFKPLGRKWRHVTQAHELCLCLRRSSRIMTVRDQYNCMYTY